MLDRKNITSDRTFEQSTSTPQGSSMGWTEVPLLPQNIWHNPQAVGFSGPGQISTTLECADHQMGVPSCSVPMFQFASSSLNSALSPSVSPSNPTPMYLQPGGAPQYLSGNCGGSAIDPGSTPMDMDYDNINRDHCPVDPERASIPAVVDIPSFPVPQNPSNELLSEDASIPNTAHSHASHPNPEVEAPCLVSTLPVSSPTSSFHDGAEVTHTSCPAVPATLVLEEATLPGSSSGSDPTASTKSKRGKSGFNYKLSSSLPVALE